MDSNNGFWKVPDEAFYIETDYKGWPTLWLRGSGGSIEDAKAFEAYLVSRYDAKFTRKVDGIFEGVWAFKIEGMRFYLGYDDYDGFGIYSVRKAKKYHAKLEEIAADLRGRFWSDDDENWYIE